MKVTPVKKNFGKHQVGDVFDLPDNAAKLFIKVGKLQAAPAVAVNTYQHRMMQAATQAEPAPVAHQDAPVKQAVAEPSEEAPYGYTQAGTPRKRPAPAAKKAAK